VGGGGLVEIEDLNHEERIALVALIELLVESDAAVSEQEIDHIQDVAAAIGPDEFRKLAEEVDRSIEDEDALKDLLRRIQRPEARELIFETALETAIPDGILTHESEILEWLEAEWDLKVEIGDV
jgi:uncharacterized protein YhaN